MPNAKRNQKVISEEEREKINQGKNAKKEYLEEVKQIVDIADNRLFEKSKENLPELLKERTKAIETAIMTELEDFKGLTSTAIHQAISKQGVHSVNRLNTYTGRELMIVLEAYTNMVTQINRTTLYVPSIASFCSYAGFSTTTFEQNYLQSPDDQKRYAAQMVKDYITNMLLDAGKMRRTDASVTIHESKAILKNVEAQSPQVIQFGGNIDPLDVLNKVEQIKKKVIDAEFKEKEK